MANAITGIPPGLDSSNSLDAPGPIEVGADTSKEADSVAARLAGIQKSTYAELLVAWRRLFRTPPPKRIGRDLLVLGLAWKIQEQAHGGHSAITKRTLADLSKAVERDGDVPRDRIATLKPGATVQREWKGTVHTVSVQEDGFEWQGKRWHSLSVIAREITGTRWSGPRFFGLKGPECSLVRVRGAGDA